MKLIHSIFLTAYLCVIGYCYVTGAWHLAMSLVFVVLLHIGFVIGKLQENGNP